ncbi:hypothetical protein WN48_11182 [Eufriesea mexicana]|uniref:Uncharacterized protein n=1 Tax=Eufriesea mexicana TaxID=516756 RepID=A0A310SDA0_9HYME|nr:hypothetical protein WN48_11182 [Eufriesea mexicana]
MEEEIIVWYEDMTFGMRDTAERNFWSSLYARFVIRLGSVQGQTGRGLRSYKMLEFNLLGVLGLLGWGLEISVGGIEEGESEAVLTGLADQPEQLVSEFPSSVVGICNCFWRIDTVTAVMRVPELHASRGIGGNRKGGKKKGKSSQELKLMRMVAENVAGGQCKGRRATRRRLRDPTVRHGQRDAARDEYQSDQNPAMFSRECRTQSKTFAKKRDGPDSYPRNAWSLRCLFISLALRALSAPALSSPDTQLLFNEAEPTGKVTSIYRALTVQPTNQQIGNKKQEEKGLKDTSREKRKRWRRRTWPIGPRGLSAYVTGRTDIPSRID